MLYLNIPYARQVKCHITNNNKKWSQNVIVDNSQYHSHRCSSCRNILTVTLRLNKTQSPTANNSVYNKHQQTPGRNFVYQTISIFLDGIYTYMTNSFFRQYIKNKSLYLMICEIPRAAALLRTNHQYINWDKLY